MTTPSVPATPASPAGQISTPVKSSPSVPNGQGQVKPITGTPNVPNQSNVNPDTTDAALQEELIDLGEEKLSKSELAKIVKERANTQRGINDLLRKQAEKRKAIEEREAKIVAREREAAKLDDPEEYIKTKGLSKVELARKWLQDEVTRMDQEANLSPEQRSILEKEQSFQTREAKIKQWEEQQYHNKVQNDARDAVNHIYSSLDNAAEVAGVRNTDALKTASARIINEMFASGTPYNAHLVIQEAVLEVEQAQRDLQHHIVHKMSDEEAYEFLGAERIKRLLMFTINKSKNSVRSLATEVVPDSVLNKTSPKAKPKYMSEVEYDRWEREQLRKKGGM